MRIPGSWNEPRSARLRAVAVVLILAASVALLIAALSSISGSVDDADGSLLAPRPEYEGSVTFRRPGSIVGALTAATVLLSGTAAYLARRRRRVAALMMAGGVILAVALAMPGSPLHSLIAGHGATDDVTAVEGRVSPLGVGLLFAWTVALLVVALFRDRNKFLTTVYVALWLAWLPLALYQARDLFASENAADVAEELVRSEYQQLLQEGANAEPIQLENGGSVQLSDGEGMSLQVGSTSEQASSSERVPLFRVSGAEGVGYLRTATGDVYRDGEWEQVDPMALSYEAGASISSLPQGPIVASAVPASSDTVTVQVRPGPLSQSISSGVAPVPAPLESVGADGEYRPHSATFSIFEATEGYSARTLAPGYSQSQLNSAGVADSPMHLELPEDLPERVRELARTVAAPASTPYGKARALESFLRTQYEYRFLNEESAASLSGRPSGDAVDWFLFEHRAGTCGNFSTAFVVLARSLGLPARVVSGWAIAPTGETQTVYSDQAHQWAEVAFDGLGWVTFEPTPGGAPSRTSASGSHREGSRSLAPFGMPKPTSEANGQTQVAQPTRTPRPTSTPPATRTPRPESTPRPRPTFVPGPTPTAISFTRPTPAPFPQPAPTPPTTFPPFPFPTGTVTLPPGTPPSGTPPPGSPQPVPTRVPTPRPTNTPVVRGTVPTETTITSVPTRLRSAEPQYVEGNVTAANGSTPHGLTVEVFLNENKTLEGATLVGTGTLNHGFYRVQVVSPAELRAGKYQAIARTRGNHTYMESMSDPEIEVVSGTHVRLRGRTPAYVGDDYAISGEVVDEAGVPVNEGQVSVTVGGTVFIVPLNDENDGAFSVNHTFEEPGAYDVTAAFSGSDLFLDQQVTLTVTVLYETELELSWPTQIDFGQEFPLTGRLTTTLGEPVSGQNVSIDTGTGPATQARTDSAGVFRSSPALPAPGRYTVTAEFPGTAGAYAAATGAAEITVLMPTSLTLEGVSEARAGDGHMFSGRLLDAEGTALDGKTVSMSIDGVLSSHVTDDEGRFEAAGTFNRAGVAEIRATLPQSGFHKAANIQRDVFVFMPTEVTLTAPARVQVNEAAEVSGTVRDVFGNALAGVDVALSFAPDGPDDASVTTDAGGQFVFEHVFASAGDHVARAAVPPEGPLLGSEGTADVIVFTVDIQPLLFESLSRGAPADLAGVLMLSDAPLADEPVQLLLDDSVVAEGATAPDGRFNIEWTPGADVEPGQHTLSYAVPRFDEEVSQEVLVRAVPIIETTPPEEVEPGEESMLLARLVDDAGAPLAGEALRLAGTDQVQVTDEEGGASFQMRVEEGESRYFSSAVEFEGTDEYTPVTAAFSVPYAAGSGLLWLWVALGGIGGFGIGTGLLFMRQRRNRTDGAGLAALPARAGMELAAAAAHVTVDEEPVPARAATTLSLSFPQIGGRFPLVWGVNEPLTVECRLLGEPGEAVAHVEVEIVAGGTGGGVEAVDRSGCATGRLTFDARGATAVSVRYAGDEARAPAEASAEIRIVDYRAEIVRLFNEFMRRFEKPAGPLPADATPREAEQILTSRNLVPSEKALDELIRVFEEADYSLHPIDRSHYERAFIAITRLDPWEESHEARASEAAAEPA